MIVGLIDRRTMVTPGHDCIYAPCTHTPKGDHGINADDDWLAVVAEISDGRKIALSLQLDSGRFPATIPASHWSDWLPPMVYPRASDLSLHVQRSRHDLGGHACEWFGQGGRCDVEYTTALGAISLFSGFTFPSASFADRERSFREPAERWKAQGGPDEALWTRLSDELRELEAKLHQGTL
jgi:hypothetical protein